MSHPNQTDLALLFCTSPLICNQLHYTKGDLYEYSVIYNKSNIRVQSLTDTTKAIPKADRAMILKLQVDDILANYLSTHRKGEPYKR